MSTDRAETEESKMGPQGGGKSKGEGCNDGDSDSEGCNDMDDNGDDDVTDYDDGDGGHYYECELGRRSN